MSFFFGKPIRNFLLPSLITKVDILVLASGSKKKLIGLFIGWSTTHRLAL